MESRRRVSVVIPTYERRRSLERTLRALTLQTIAASEFEVVVSLDGSQDGTCEMIRGFTAPYQLRAHWQANRGRATACNRGVDLAHGDLIVLLDDDMEPTPGFLAAHLAAHRAQRPLAVMGAAPIVAERTTTVASAYVRTKFNAHLERLAAPNHTFALRDFYSGNLSIARRVFLDAGGFDEEFEIYGNEDLELWWRLRARGVELAFCETAVAYQHYSKDVSALARDNVAKGRTSVLLAKKHPATRSQLKLATAARGPWVKRALIRVLLSVTRAWPHTIDVVIGAVRLLSRFPAPGRITILGLALDYCYFAGARAAEHESARTAPRLEAGR